MFSTEPIFRGKEFVDICGEVGWGKKKFWLL